MSATIEQTNPAIIVLAPAHSIAPPTMAIALIAAYVLAAGLFSYFGPLETISQPNLDWHGNVAVAVE